jgi:phosphoribosylformimino-5-aminoimidazole carboxamide ribotide isomerase
MTGPSIDLYKEILDRFPGISLLASGGVRSIQDIEKLQKLGVCGVVFGKAFYEGALTLKDLERFLVNA